MSWNHRVFKLVNNHEYLDKPEILFEIREVFYDENGDVSAIAADWPDVIADSLEGLKLTLNKMLESCDKPIIDYNTGEEIQELN